MVVVVVLVVVVVVMTGKEKRREEKKKREGSRVEEYNPRWEAGCPFLDIQFWLKEAPEGTIASWGRNQFSRLDLT